MTRVHDQLEALFDQVRSLPVERQQLAIEALREIASSEAYELSHDELAILMPTLERAARGEYASDDEVKAALMESWS